MLMELHGCPGLARLMHKLEANESCGAFDRTRIASSSTSSWRLAMVPARFHSTEKDLEVVRAQASPDL